MTTAPSIGTWPAEIPAVGVRIARPTRRLAEVCRFHCDELGLPELFRAQGHGYEVVMIGLPGAGFHLEFTTHPDGDAGEAPTAENLLVLYFAGPEEAGAVAKRMAGFGHRPVPLENPWWSEHGAVAFADPDGWRVVLMPQPVDLTGDAQPS